MREKKINFTIYPNHSIFFEGKSAKIEKAESDFVEGLRSKNMNISLAGFINKSSNSALQGFLDDKGSLKIISLGRMNEASIFSKFVSYSRSIVHIIDSVKRSTFNYIFFPGNVAYIAVVIALILNKPFALYVRGSWVNKWHINWLNIWMFKRSEFIFTTGPAFKDEISKYNELVAEVVPMINFSRINISPIEGICQDSKSLIFIGRISRAKGIYDVVEALAILNKKNINLSLDIVGGGIAEDFSELSTWISKNNVEDMVHIHGHISEPEKLMEILMKGKVFVFPTTYREGFPRVVYEAMLLGVPVITTKMPGAKGFLVDNVNCLIVNPNQPVHLASQISRLLDDSSLYSKLKNNARNMVSNKFNNFDKSNHSEQVLKALKSISL